MVRAAAQRRIRLSPAKDGFDEAFEPSGAVRPHYRPLVSTLRGSTPADLERRERLQKLSLMSLGITFTVYGAEEGIERVWPFDIVPRIVPADEWKRLEAGLVQRIITLNLFLHEEIRQIDLPVCQEVPERRVERAITPLEEAAAQQQ